MAKNEFLVAITQLAAEKNLPKEVVFDAVEAALASAYKKDALAESNVVVKIDPETGISSIFTRQTVVDEIEDPLTELTLEEGRKQRPGIKVGEFIDSEVPAQYAGRVAAQTAKQVVLQRLREAEREVVFEEYSGREGDIVSGEMVRMEGRNVIIDLGKAEALLPPAEQVRNEHYRSGQRMKFYVMEVYKAAKGPQVVVSRTHKNLIRRLFELEVPEIFKGIVEVKAISREGGYRSKVAVWSTQEGVDPVGACVGLRGVRIQNIVNELNGERIDVVLWDPEAGRFVAHALSPAQVVQVKIKQAENTAEVVVPDRQLSLAIGKEGQNARLAAKMTGWRIDIKSQSAYEEYIAANPVEEEEEEIPVPSEAIAEEPHAVAAGDALPLSTEREGVLATAGQAGPAAEAVAGAPAEVLAEGEVAKPQIRFGEDLLKQEQAGKATKKTKGKKEEEEGAGKATKKGRRPRHMVDEEMDDDYDYSFDFKDEES
jgi:transcription termination/antitermination protein NusA